MRNILMVLISGLLMLGTAAAQQAGSVDSVLRELEKYTVAAPAPAVEQPAAAKPAPAAPAPAPVRAEAVIAPEQVPAVIEQSREAYTTGEFAKAQAGFEAVIKIAPEHPVARMYLRRLLERDARTAEVAGMKAVDAAWCPALVLRSYAVSKDAAAKMGLDGAAAAVDAAGKFPEVQFPKGATAVYQPKLDKLFVRNTRDNLTILEEILSAMDVADLSSKVDQVEIEAKFVEVSEGTLEQLGFEWRNNGNDVNLFDDVTMPGGQYLFDDALRGGPSGPSMPFTVPSALGAGSAAAAIPEWTAFRFEDTFSTTPGNLTVQRGGNNPFDVVISALDQSSGADVLSAPRVVTQSGKKATIRVGNLHYYPEVYEAGASFGNIVHVRYEDWNEKLLGVDLSVTPQVDGDQIDMALNPVVTELQGWQKYEVAPANSAYTFYQGITRQRFTHDPIEARLPIFRKREVKTEVTIADGATIGMGGLINERVEAYTDKVPVLGSLPLVGRLFRNEGERAVKRNLLMFVTARKIEPTGRINTARSFE